MIDGLFSCTATLAVLLTSRISSLPVGDRRQPLVKLDGLSEADAVELLRQQLGQLQPVQLQLSARELAQLAQLCQYNPLLLMFVASMLRRGRCTLQVRSCCVGHR